LKDLNPSLRIKTEVIGKPSTYLFELALSSSDVAKSRVVMIGDQLATDILGANNSGIDSCLVGTGLTQIPISTELQKSHQPKLIIESFT
ncbi:MAG: HAD hydrolase-like protein, partial [Bdellovibrionota bacterium]